MIGIGVNVAIEPDEFPADLRWPATSIGGGVAVAAALDAVCAALDAGSTPPARGGRSVSGPRRAGRPRVEWEDGAGVAGEIDSDGNLVVERDDGETVALGSGEVSLRLA